MTRFILSLFAFATFALALAQGWQYGTLTTALLNYEDAQDETHASWVTSTQSITGMDRGVGTYVQFCERLMDDPNPNPCARDGSLLVVLDYLGAQGWELVSVTPPQTNSLPAGGEAGEFRQMTYFFKRPAITP